MKAAVTLTTVDPVLGVEDVCKLLKVSVAQFYELKTAGRFGQDLPPLVEIQPAIDRRPRYRGDVFASWLDAKQQERLLRRELLSAVK